MAKTTVSGNKVTIDDSTYQVAPAGTGQYSVCDDFGGRLGYFTVRARAVTAEDYGVPDVHPVLQIGKLWLAANLAKTEEKGSAPQSREIGRASCRERV